MGFANTHTLRLFTHMRGMIEEMIQDFLIGFIDFGNSVVIPLLFSIAFLFFIWNAFLFFILGGSNDEGKEKAKKLMLYGLMAMILMIVIWGVVKISTRALGIDRGSIICPDYIPYCQSGQGNIDRDNWIDNFNNDRSF